MDFIPGSEVYFHRGAIGVSLQACNRSFELGSIKCIRSSSCCTNCSAYRLSPLYAAYAARCCFLQDFEKADRSEPRRSGDRTICRAIRQQEEDLIHLMATQLKAPVTGLAEKKLQSLLDENKLLIQEMKVHRKGHLKQLLKIASLIKRKSYQLF